jgi:hypothetical protein
MTRFISGLLLLSAAACSSSTTDVDGGLSTEVAAALAGGPVQVTLGYGEYKRVTEAQMGVAFNQVLSDSRCPIDAVCVWMGDAVAEIEVTIPGGRTTPVQLHTGLDPKAQVVNGVKISLLELAPAPRSSEPTRPSAYQVKLQLEKAR